jgi:hypothetical protein
LVLLVGVVSAQQSTEGSSSFFQLLKDNVGIRDRDLSTLRSTDQAVLPAHEKGEVVVVGVERLRVPLKFFLNAFTAIPTLKRGHQVLQIRDFSSPPREQDLEPLALRPQDLQVLSRCTPGDCGVKLSASMMERLRSQGLHQSSLGDEFKKVIVQYVNRYLAVGNAAMITYDDKSPPIRGLDEFRTLLHEVDWLRQAAPALHRCLDLFSGARCPAQGVKRKEVIKGLGCGGWTYPSLLNTHRQVAIHHYDLLILPA